MSKEFDPTSSNSLLIYFDDGKSRTCRVTWQKNPKNHTPRPRLIPEYIDENGKRHSAKKQWPTLFLGLSRLYPVGESIDDNLSSHDFVDYTPSAKEERENIYKRILSIMDDIKDTKTISFKDTTRKKAVGINTDKYNHWVNSAGQDNLGQILLAIESFELLKNKYEEYNGGLLLIDEVDAALHPTAQNRLFDYLIQKSKTLGIQIVCTTHSLSLLNHIACKTAYNNDNSDVINNIEWYYLSMANEFMQSIRSPGLNIVKNLLLEDSHSLVNNKVKVLTEDAEARWVINHIISGTELKDKVMLLDTKIGKNELVSLIKADPLYFSNCIIILDGDARNDSAITKELKGKLHHVLYLPGDESPEKELLVLYLVRRIHTDHPG